MRFIPVLRERVSVRATRIVVERVMMRIDPFALRVDGKNSERNLSLLFWCVRACARMLWLIQSWTFLHNASCRRGIPHWRIGRTHEWVYRGMKTNMKVSTSIRHTPVHTIERTNEREPSNGDFRFCQQRTRLFIKWIIINNFDACSTWTVSLTDKDPTTSQTII